MKTLTKKVLLAASVAAALSVGQSAMADTLRFDGLTFGSEGAFTFSDTSPVAGPSTVSAGAFNVTDLSGPTLSAGASFMAWCVTAFTSLTTTTNYTLRTSDAFYAP